MAQYVTIQELVNAEKWKGDNYATIFEFLGWDVWDKRDNSASGPNFSIDNTPMEEGMESGGNGILYVAAGIAVPIGSYIVREDDYSLSVINGTEFEAKYKKA